jgi:hypothetical protein
MLNRMLILGAVALGFAVVASVASAVFAVNHLVTAKRVKARESP